MRKIALTRPTANASITRRQFIGRSAAAAGAFAVPTIIPASALGADGAVAPSERVVMGQIGRGMMGRGHLVHFAQNKLVQLVAVCEVDRLRREEGKAEVESYYADATASGTYHGCATYNDYRELLARADIDAVSIATPDHWHTPISIHAAEAGKDVYCEKPNSICIGEGRQLVQAMERHGRVFQNGSQYRTIPAFRRACEFIRKGGLGPVKSAFTLWNGIGGAGKTDQRQPYTGIIQGETNGSSRIPLDFALPGSPVPEELDWDLWLGPALWRPYNPAYHRNPMPGVVPWAFCDDFGVGPSTWYHSHAADVLQYALGYEESGPVEILHPATGEFPTMTYRYANGVTLHLVDGWGQINEFYGALPEGTQIQGGFGGVVVGERGWMSVLYGDGGMKGGPDELWAEFNDPKHDPPPGSRDHHTNWLECIKTRQKPSSHAEIGHRGASLGHLTIIACKLGRSLKWDPVKEIFPEDEQANRLLNRAKRAPWHC